MSPELADELHQKGWGWLVELMAAIELQGADRGFTVAIGIKGRASVVVPFAAEEAGVLGGRAGQTWRADRPKPKGWDWRVRSIPDRGEFLTSMINSAMRDIGHGPGPEYVLLVPKGGG